LDPQVFVTDAHGGPVSPDAVLAGLGIFMMIVGTFILTRQWK
jgi:hypothetical protein